MVHALLLVGLGGAVGAIARYGVGRLLPAPGFPWATLLVNVAGGFMMGLLAGWLAARDGGEGWRLFLGVGVLGGFTTFSAFSLDMLGMLERGAVGLAAAYALLSVILSVGALAVGWRLVRVALS